MVWLLGALVVGAYALSLVLPDRLTYPLFLAATLALVDQIGYAAAYSFKYSPRPGTPAADMRETVSTADMDARLERLQGLIDSQQSAFNRAAIGRTVDVLFERAGGNAGQIVGRTPFLQAVNVMAPSHLLGEMADVVIEDVGNFSLFGRLVEPVAPDRPSA